MIIPNFIDIKVVDEKGYFTPEWREIMNTLFTQMQNNLSEEGIQLPLQDDTNVGLLNNSKSKARLLYNSDTNKAIVNINGTYKEILTT